MPVYVEGKLKKAYAGVGSGYKVKKIYSPLGLVFQSTIYVDKPTNLTVVAAYTGSTITNGYTCPTGVTMTGTDRSSAAGVFTATYTPQEGYAWRDGTTTAVTVTLTVQYVWKVYSVNASATESVTTKTVASEGQSTLKSDGNWAYAKQGTAYSFNSATGKYNLTSTYSFRALTASLRSFGGTGVPYVGLATAEDGQTGSFSGVVDLSASQTNLTSQISITTVKADNSSSSNDYTARLLTLVTTYSRGTDTGTTVSSITDPSAYPSDGKQGDYWYVKTW